MINSINNLTLIGKKNKKRFNSATGFKQLNIIDSTDKNGVNGQDEQFNLVKAKKNDDSEILFE